MIEELSLKECAKRYPTLDIDMESIGLDRGVNFTTVGVKYNSYGKPIVSEYIPRPGTGYKKCDLYNVITDTLV